MSLTLSYSSMSGGFAPIGAMTIDKFDPTTLHFPSSHNNVHAKLLANDIELTNYINNIGTTGEGYRYLVSVTGYQEFPSGFLFQWAVGQPMQGDPPQVITWSKPFIQTFNFHVSAYATDYTGVDGWFQIENPNETNITVRYQYVTSYPYSMTPYVFGLGTWKLI